MEETANKEKEKVLQKPKEPNPKDFGLTESRISELEKEPPFSFLKMGIITGTIFTILLCVVALKFNFSLGAFLFFIFFVGGYFILFFIVGYESAYYLNLKVWKVLLKIKRRKQNTKENESGGETKN